MYILLVNGILRNTSVYRCTIDYRLQKNYYYDLVTHNTVYELLGNLLYISSYTR